MGVGRAGKTARPKPFVAACGHGSAILSAFSCAAFLPMTDPTLEAQRAVATEMVALTLLADGVLASRELEALDRLGIAQLLGVERDTLIQAIIDHCRRLLQRPARID